MISSTLGAPFGGTTVGGQYGLDCSAPKLMVPPNFGGGGGRYLPSIVSVALGAPGTPLICWAVAGPPARAIRVRAENVSIHVFMTSSPLFQATGIMKSRLGRAPRPCPTTNRRR